MFLLGPEPWPIRRILGGQELVHRRGVEAVPVIRPILSRNVVVPFKSMVAVPVARPMLSRNVFMLTSRLRRSPHALTALATLRVAERNCKIKLPQAIVIITQKRQPDAFQTSMREAQQIFHGMDGTGMEYLACGLTKMMIDEFVRQHGL